MTNANANTLRPDIGIGVQASTKRTTHPIIGSRVRDLRKAKAMTLQNVADGTSLSVGYLSQLEREQAMPSIRALNVISQFLGVNINWFFPEEEESAESDVIVRASKRRALRTDAGIRDELLSPSLSGDLELLHCTLDPGADSGPELFSHRGEEAGFIAEGQLELTIDGEVYLLGKGDSFHFDSQKEHRYHNPGSEKTIVIWALTPPYY
ncbi:XRE family transcriptional regulator [Roseovarius aestuarii]|nr:XRE family transcriptional regulator [Roseovarius aestuarii]